MTANSMRFQGSYTVVALAALVVGLLFSGTAAARGACVSAVIDEPFVLPGGSAHDAGRLSLCIQRTHSPIATLHEMRVDGMAVGLQQSRRGTTEERSSAPPFMVFTRNAEGRLLLDGYAESDSAGTTLYALRVPLTRVRTFMLSEADNQGAGGDRDAVILAAMLD